MNEHRYSTRLIWTGAKAGPTLDYKTFSRDWRIDIEGKPPLSGSSDPHFAGDPAQHNPEDLLLAALSSCHMLTYLALAPRQGLIVLSYSDDAEGVMSVDKGGGQFSDVLLKPVVTVKKGSDTALAVALHEEAHRLCFIARSVNFPVRNAPRIIEQA